MKTFKDLQIKAHPIGRGAVIARLEFDNGTYISVVGGPYGCGLYGNGESSFEIMSTVTERTVSGVEGWLTISKVSSRMRYLQTIKQI